LLCDEVLCESVAESARRAVDLGILRVDLPAERIRAIERIPEERYSEAYTAIEGKRRDMIGALQAVRASTSSLKASLVAPSQAEALARVRLAADNTAAVMDAAIHDLFNVISRMACELLRLGKNDDVFVPLTYGASLPKATIGTNAWGAVV